MPVNPKDLPEGQITGSQVLEYCDSKSFRTDSFSLDKANSQVTFYIPGDKLKAFVLFALGGAYVEYAGGGSYGLKRLLPMPHPFWPWLYCTQLVSINGEGFDGDSAEAIPFDIHAVPLAKWKKYVVVCNFDQLPYDVLGNDDPALLVGGVRKEYNRFFSVETIPNVQLVSVEQGSVTYDANAGDAWNSKPTTQVKTRRETAGLKMKWWFVPAEFVHDRNKLPRKLLAIQGRVNSEDPWYGEFGETLLCEDVKLEKFVFPFLTDAFGQLYFGYHIEFTMLWFDPTPKGKAAEARHGWNFYLQSKDLQWYYGTAGGNKVYQTTTFDSAFTHWSQP